MRGLDPFVALVFTLTVGSFSGCGPRDTLGFTPVLGVVTLDGKPLESGEIRFEPDAFEGSAGPGSASPLGKDGRFSLRGPGTRIGALPGSHRVYLVASDPLMMAAEPLILIDGTFVRPDGTSELSAGSHVLVPPCFLAPETSGMIATVTPGKPNRIDFDLASPTATEEAGSK